ncbi:hypothetical protein IFM89_032264 [Coptis chinensis]|uniref:Uncharacterized protein n=1 Tax=Coptis chinensis TaxID=261450 RepID=A0A835ID68_9MAGN|nr:hypothetical protein IFM89_032264 [Coptis chinensis]
MNKAKNKLLFRHRFLSFRADKGDTLKGSYVHYPVFLRGVFGVIEIARRFSTNENTIAYLEDRDAIDDPTLVKARLTKNGKLGALCDMMNSNPSRSDNF